MFWVTMDEVSTGAAAAMVARSRSDSVNFISFVCFGVADYMWMDDVAGSDERLDAVWWGMKGRLGWQWVNEWTN